MAVRPAYYSSGPGGSLVGSEDIEFTWSPGLSMSQRRLSARSLAKAVRDRFPDKKVLEVSRMSDNPLGVQLSAFNLVYPAGRKAKNRPVECVFQSGKVFQHGGPFKDLLLSSPAEAKSDPRLKESGTVIKFELEGRPWPTDPPTVFYDWIYLNSLHARKDLAEGLSEFEIFTDVAFNPKRSVNCQARTVAIYVALEDARMTHDVLLRPESFIEFMQAQQTSSNVSQEQKSFLF